LYAGAAGAALFGQPVLAAGGVAGAAAGAGALYPP